MRKLGFFKSTLSAILLAILLFFVVYFFMPSLSLRFFNLSWTNTQENKALASVVRIVLEDADLPKSKIDRYFEEWEDAYFQEQLLAAKGEGQEAIVNTLVSIGEGLEDGDFAQRLDRALAQSAKLPRSQRTVLRRLLVDTLENL